MIDETPSQPPPHEGEGSLPGRRQRGFTLIELWVSILIIGTMAGLTVAAFQRNTQFEKLRSVRDELLDDLRTMRSYSVSGRSVKDTFGAECTAAKCGGHGVYLSSSSVQTLNRSYRLFQDFDGDRQFDDNDNERIAPLKTLPENIRIDAITYINCGSYGGGSCFSSSPDTISVSAVSVHFASHFGTTTFTSQTPNYSQGQQVRIRLRDTASNRTLDFTVDRLAGGIRE